MSTGVFDLYIHCGTTVDAGSLTFTYKAGDTPVDLTGYSARAKAVGSLNGHTLFDVSSLSGSIALGGPSGSISLLISASQTSAMWRGNPPTQVGRDRMPWAKAGRWDLELTEPGGSVRRLLMGDVYLSPEVTTL